MWPWTSACARSASAPIPSPTGGGREATRRRTSPACSRTRGVCHCCLVAIDGRPKRRACQTVVRPGMRVETESNRFDQEERP
ncbi:2Fe-2S iron-sulfur cluster-binding protein [Pseudomonas aeruginosa]|uniref:2Fe-2S iron-sulfur cluster-binding protein n=1 Tax=Pseudomonas aeruginosa TaxID=287 RepID=UPI003891A6CD